jgi:hypothetical protein
MPTTLTHRLDERIVYGITLAIAAGALALANFAGNGDNGGAGPYAATLAVTAVLAAVLLFRVLPTTADPARAGWILGALALVTCVAFWSGLPFALGIPAIYAGARAGRSGPQVLGALAVIAAAVGCAIG